jgi:hypothetical protein
MQDKNKAIVKKILLAIAEHKNVDKLRGLSTLLEVNESTLYAWIKRGKIGNVGAILKVLPYLNVTWLETGTGPMMILDQGNFHLYPGTAEERQEFHGKEARYSKIAATIHPGRKLLQENSRAAEMEPAPSQAKPPEVADDDIEELRRMSERVLRSKTVYRSAWASNCRAFYQAVIKEEEMKTTNERLDAMTAEMTELKELIKALLHPDQKREQKAG